MPFTDDGRPLHGRSPPAGRRPGRAQVESLHSLKITARPGSRQDLRVGASSRVLLAFLPDEERDAVLASGAVRPRTKDTVTDVDTIRSLLADVRALGHCVSVGEIDAGVVGVAAPVRDQYGSVVAALGIVAPQARIPGRQALDRTIRLVVDEAHRSTPLLVRPPDTQDLARA